MSMDVSEAVTYLPNENMKTYQVVHWRVRRTTIQVPYKLLVYRASLVFGIIRQSLPSLCRPIVVSIEVQVFELF